MKYRVTWVLNIAEPKHRHQTSVIADNEEMAKTIVSDMWDRQITIVGVKLHVSESTNPDEPMDSYYVTMRSMPNDYRRQERYSADDFAHAEEQAQQDLMSHEEIIQIERDYKE